MDSPDFVAFKYNRSRTNEQKRLVTFAWKENFQYWCDCKILSLENARVIRRILFYICNTKELLLGVISLLSVYQFPLNKF